MDVNARNGSSVDGALLEPVAPHDELTAELESYAKSLYEVATLESVQRLNDGVRKALEMLEMSFTRATDNIDRHSGALSESIEAARSDFRGMFDPVFQAYQRRFIEDQAAFLDMLLSRFSPVIREQTESLTRTQKENAEYVASMMQIRYAESQTLFDERLGSIETMKITLDRKLRELEEAQRSMAERFEKFAEQNVQNANEVGERVASEVDRSVKQVFHTQATAAEKATGVVQKAIQETQLVQQQQAKMQNLVFVAVALGLVNLAVSFLVR